MKRKITTNAISYLREDIKCANELLEQVMADVNQEQASWIPDGIANPIGATYAHAVAAEDAVIQGIIKTEANLFESSWKNMTGISDPQFHSKLEWARRLKVDLAQARQYAGAVYQASDAYLASLAEDDLDRQIDLTQQGFGMKSVALILSALLIAHTNNLIGEISVLKGLQGVKGYPW